MDKRTKPEKEDKPRRVNQKRLREIARHAMDMSPSIEKNMLTDLIYHIGSSDRLLKQAQRDLQSTDAELGRYDRQQYVNQPSQKDLFQNEL